MIASVPAENQPSSAAVIPVENVPAVPLAVVFQKESTPHVPLGVAPAPAVAPLLSQYKEVAFSGAHGRAQKVTAARKRYLVEVFMDWSSEERGTSLAELEI